MSSYEKLKEIKNQYRLDHFVMACAHFFDIGYRNALEITDEEIENAQENGLMTKEFVQFLMRTARELAQVSESAIDVVQFCAAEDIFDTRYYVNKLSRNTLEEMIEASLCHDEYDFSKVKDIEEACEKYNCDAEDFETLGYELTEKYFE